MIAARLAEDEELHWLALRMVPGLGPRTAMRLLEQFKTPRAVFRLSRSELEAAGVSGSQAQTITSGCSFDDAVTQQKKARDAGAVAVPVFDPCYPQKLREIFDPPPLLFARGDVGLLATLTLGVVGTRRPTPYGIAATERLTKDLARAGLTIVSGMARGVDTAAHRAAVAAEGKTVAVLGCGTDVVYPSENRKLAQQIVEKGLIISEFPMGSPAYPQNFPIRNRIISGLSTGVLVVEGAQYSGSSITARLALEQGREVFAVPGNITSRMSWGPNLLIKDGAKLVQEATDIIEELRPEERRELISRTQGQLFDGPETVGASGASEECNALPNPVGRQVLGLLKVDTATHIDDLLETADVSSSEVIAALFDLEMQGAIRQLPGKNFVRVW